MSGKVSAFGAAVLVWLAGCSGGGAGEWHGTERDSAGIAIVENPATPVWGRDGGWQVEEELRIGALAGDRAYQFGRITGLAMDEADRIYVLDQQANEVRAFDGTGAHLFTAGGPGSGPGELSPMASQILLLPGNGTILVPDVMLQRVNRFTAEGEPAGSVELRMEEGILLKSLVTPAGEVIQQLQSLPMPAVAETDAFNRLVVRDAEGVGTGTVVELPLGEGLRFRGGEVQFLIFAANPVWTVLSDGRIVTGKDSEVRLEIRSVQGELERVFTMPFERRRLTPSDEAAYRGAIVSLMEEQGVPRPIVQQMASAMQFAEYLPAFATLLGGPDGTVWLQRVQTPEEAAAAGSFDIQDFGGAFWDVFDADGRYLGPIRMPERFSLREIRGEALIGVWRDDMDVQHVMRLRLVR